MNSILESLVKQKINELETKRIYTIESYISNYMLKNKLSIFDIKNYGHINIFPDREEYFYKHDLIISICYHGEINVK